MSRNSGSYWSDEESADENAASLTQYKLDSEYDSLSDDSDIEVCVDSFCIQDTEGMCCDMLLNKFKKRKALLTWKLRAASLSAPVFDKEEFFGLKEQADRNATAQLRRERHRFLLQYSNLASITLQKFALARLFGRWTQKVNQRRYEKLCEDFADQYAHRRTLEKSLHAARTAFMRRKNKDFEQADKDASFITSSDRARDLLNELARTKQRSILLEQEIAVKTDRLADLQAQLRDLAADEADSDRKLKEIAQKTAKTQSSIADTEHRYQDEVASLKTQLNIAESHAKEELQRVTDELQMEAEERRAASAFVDAAQAAAQAELLQLQERIQAAEEIVRNFRGLLEQGRDRAAKLAQSRQLLASELESLRIKRRQLEVANHSSRVRAADREEKMKALLEQAQEDLKVAINSVEGQDEKIKSQTQEIKMLREDIARSRTRATEVHDRFLRQTQAQSPGRYV